MMASSANSNEIQPSSSAGSTEYEQVIQKIRKCRKNRCFRGIEIYLLSR